MIPKPTLQEIKTIGYYIGRVVIGYGLLMTIPIFISFIMGEYNEGINFFIGFLCCLITGYSLVLCGQKSSNFSLIQGMVIVSFTWLIAMFLGAIPYVLSGHFLSYLDGCFDLMSGFGTAGFSLIQDLDHISYTLNIWRFIVPYVGGQGIIIVALTVFVRTTGLYGMYIGEGREENILPNLVNTARIIWFLSLSYLAVSVIALWLGGLFEGLTVGRAFWHSLCIGMSSWSTSGFAPQSTSLLYYHSFLIEMITITVCFLGAINFSIHYTLISGNWKEIYRSLECIVFFISFSLVMLIVLNGLDQSGTYSDVISFFRQAFFQAASAHTTTGHSTIYSSIFVSEWGALAMIGLIIAMGIGGNSGSTAGGIKNLRIGILINGMIQDIKQVILPKSAIMKHKFHHIKDILLEDKIIRTAMFVTFCYLLTYGLGTLAGVWCGYPFLEALFESVSATTGTGLSSGVVSTQTPSFLKIVYIFEMWAGRLEFMSIFALISFIISSTQTWHSGKRVIR